MLSYRKLAMCVLGRPLHTVGGGGGIVGITGRSKNDRRGGTAE